MTQFEIVEKRSKELKSFVGLALSYDDCQEFVISVLSDVKNAQL